MQRSKVKSTGANTDTKACREPKTERQVGSQVKFEPSTCDEFNSVRPNTMRTGMGVYGNLHPLEAYLALKSLFNNPDYDNLDEDKQQWVFFLKADNAHIEVYDWKRSSWYIGVYTSNEDHAYADSLIKALSEQVNSAARAHRGLVTSLRVNPAGYVLENPFALYYETADELIRIAEQLYVPWSPRAEPPLVGDLGTPSTLCRSAFVQLIAAVEGLLNLLSELYLRPDLREPRIMDRIAREQIDIKLRLLPIYCDCFTGKPLDREHAAIKAFGRIVNTRNDLIHANLTKGMKTPVVVHDRCTFYLPIEQPRQPFAVNSISDLGIDELKAIKTVIDELIAYLVASMNPRDRKVFGSVMHDEFIHVEYVDGVPVIQTEAF